MGVVRLSDVTHWGHTSTLPCPPYKGLLYPPGFLWAHGDEQDWICHLLLGNKENSQMRSRTKWAVSALQWGRRFPGLQGRGAGFLLRIFPSLTSSPPPSPLHAPHGCSGSNKSPAIAGADLLFISKCLKDKLWEGVEMERGSQGVKALVLGLKVDLAAPLGGCCTTLKKWMPIKSAVTDVWECLNCLVKKKDCGM